VLFFGAGELRRTVGPAACGGTPRMAILKNSL
jgi:hypothetical protein